MGVFSLVGRPALSDLLDTTDDKIISFWFGAVTAMFLVGAATGGVLFGWLGDRIGRVRAMMLSVLTYAVFTGLCGLAAEAWQVATLRFIASLGMGGEWALGVALVMEIWPNRSRALLAGLIGAAANVGYLLIAFVGLALTNLIGPVADGLSAIGFSDETVQWLTGNQAWRLLMLSGTAPAALTFLIRLFVPESEKWTAEKAKGSVSSWATVDLLGVLIGAAGPAAIVYLWAVDQPLGFAPLSLELSPHAVTTVRIVGTLLGMIVATVGYSFPVVRYLQRDAISNPVGAQPWRPILRRMMLAAGLSAVPLLATWASVQWAPTWADKLTDGAMPTAKSWTQIYSALGATLGTIAAALLGGKIGRRLSYVILCVTSFASIQLLFLGNDAYTYFFLFSVFLAGFCTASFYGWLPLYLPELFPTRVRATGQGFGFNFGRILAAVGALQTGNLIRTYFNGDYSQACSIMGSVYLVGVVLIIFAPETKGKPLPD
jgi:MFS family permease